MEWFQDEFFNGDGLNIHNRFLTSTYSHPTKIDLYELFYLGGGEHGSNEPVIPEEERAVILKDYGGAKAEGSCIKITREEMGRILAPFSGISVGTAKRNLDLYRPGNRRSPAGKMIQEDHK